MLLYWRCSQKRTRSLRRFRGSSRELALTDFQLCLSGGDRASQRGSRTHTQSSGQGDIGSVCYLGTERRTICNNTGLGFDSTAVFPNSFTASCPQMISCTKFLEERRGRREKRIREICFFGQRRFRLCPLSTCFFSEVCSELGRAQYVFFNVLARSHEAMINPWMASLAVKFERLY